MDQLQGLVIDPLKPYLSPITTNLPAPVNEAIISLIGSPCHSALLLDLDVVSHPECVTLAISKALGILIVSAAAIVKVPQIVKLLRSQSAEGLSFVSYVLETASFVITLAYNVRSGFPFSTYGENAFIAVQDVLITSLILVYSGAGVATAGGFVAAVMAVVYALLGNTELVSASQMTQLQAGAGVMNIAGKLPQIWAIYRQGGTGQLSAFAVFNFLLGSMSRIFTTLQEVDDKLILYGSVAGFTLNAVLALQMVYYWNSPTTAGHGAEAVVGKNKQTIKGIGQSGAQGLATDENLLKAGVPVGVSSGARPNSSSGRRRG